MTSFLRLYRKCLAIDNGNPVHRRLLTVGLKNLFNPLNWFAVGEQGAWYDPSDFQPNWRRNLLTYTENFSNPAWTTVGATIGVGVIAPDGSVSQKITSNASTVGSYVYRGIIPAAGGLTFSGYVKSDGICNWVQIAISGSGVNTGIARVWVNLITGAVGTIIGGWSSVAITSVGNGWFRVSCITTVTATTGNYYFANATGNGIDGYAGDGTSGIYIWGAQLEQSSSASTYQKITDGIQDYYTVQPQPVLFQDSAGTTPVTAVEQPVGLMLDKSKGLALGAELVTNGDFSNGTAGWSGWTAAGAVVNGELVYTNAPNANASGIYQTTPSYSGGVYKITLTVKSISSGAITVTLGIGLPTSSNCFNITSAGTYSFTQTNNSVDAYLRVYPIGTSTTATIDNISVKQIAGNHVFQATAGNRPVLSARVNLLTKTEDFSSGWAQDGAVPTTNLLTASAGSSAHGVYQGTSNVLGTSTTCFFDVKQGTHRYIQILYGADATSFANFDLQTGLPGTTGTSATATMTDIGGGIYRCKILSTSVTATATVWIVLAPSASATRYQLWTALGTETVNVYKADLRPTNSGALLPPYQRVNTASDYDTVGFPLYLKANGTSSAMSTNSIDFTSTDKMTVVTGVRKLANGIGSSDWGMVAELSVSTNLNSGAFALVPQGTSAYSFTLDSVYKANGTVSDNITNNSAYLAPTSLVLANKIDFAAPSNLLRANGTQAALSTVNVGSGNFGNYPLYLFARASTSGFLNGNFYGAIIRGAQSDTASVTQTENYMATKTGITF